MFRKATTAITIAAFAAVIVLSSQGSASAEEVGTVEDTCAEAGICIEVFHGIHDWAYPHPTGIEVEGGFVADAPVALTPTLPDGVLDAITDPLVDLSMLPGIFGLPEEPGSDAPETAPADPAPADPAPADPAPADPAPAPAPAPADPAPAPPHTDDPDVPAPVPAPAHEDQPGAAGSTGAEQPADDPVVEPTTTTSTSTTTTSPTNQDDDDDELVAAAADPTTDGDTGEAFDPATAALFGALGALGLFTVGTAAFVIGRRGT